MHTQFWGEVGTHIYISGGLAESGAAVEVAIGTNWGLHKFGPTQQS